ncbi:MAG: PTS IIA-like nitrogen regulatory protein PtsN [Halioglobus sp.]|nr:PTS IIA-like nitrogen regulatory protein PtsN [Halioglobus sp.]
MHILNQILTPERTVSHAHGPSKKRLFETIVKLVCANEPSLHYEEILDHLITREKLGSTGLGGGIAIPHCRVGSCTQPLGALLSLATPIPFDAPDDQPVDLLFVLLVPEEACQQHLDILANVAHLFSQQAFCRRLRAARDSHTLYKAACRDAE